MIVVNAASADRLDGRHAAKDANVKLLRKRMFCWRGGLPSRTQGDWHAWPFGWEAASAVSQTASCRIVRDTWHTWLDRIRRGGSGFWGNSSNAGSGNSASMIFCFGCLTLLEHVRVVPTRSGDEEVKRVVPSMRFFNF